MATSTFLLKQIKEDFIKTLENKKIIQNDDRLRDLAELFKSDEMPTPDQLKQILFGEELS